MAKNGERSSENEIASRVLLVQEKLLGGATRTQIQKMFSFWKLSDRTLDTYIAKAWELIKEINAVTLEQNMAAVTTQLWDLYKEAREMGEPMVALKTLAQICKIRGLEETKLVIEHRDFKDVTDAELDAILAAAPNGTSN